MRRAAIVATASLLALVCVLFPERPGPATAAYFALSPARSASGRFIPADRLGSSDYCGACHTEIFHEWGASTHHFSSLNNPFYRHVALATRLEQGTDTLKLCAGCHDPIPLMSGEMDQLDIRDWPANAGITCVVCHRIDNVHGHNGGYSMAAPSLDTLALSSRPLLRDLHSAFVKLVPGLHNAQFTRPLYSTPEYCGACHSLVSPKDVNGVADVVLQDDYESWRHGPYSGHGETDAAGERRTCIDCHMPLVPSRDPAARDGLIRSHRFLGGNTALPQLNRDDEQLRATEEFLRTHGPRVRFAGLDLSAASLVLAVEVSNDGVGHAFPGGTSESNEAWLRLEVSDRDGQPVFATGTVGPGGEIAGAPVFLRSVFLDSEGRPTARGTTSTKAVARGDDSTLRPRETRRYQYRVGVPAGARFPLQARAALKWRKFSTAFTREVFHAASAGPPALRITTIAEASAQIGPLSRP
jgi:hypothetical protein